MLKAGGGDTLCSLGKTLLGAGGAGDALGLCRMEMHGQPGSLNTPLPVVAWLSSSAHHSAQVAQPTMATSPQ